MPFLPVLASQSPKKVVILVYLKNIYILKKNELFPTRSMLLKLYVKISLLLG